VKEARRNITAARTRENELALLHSAIQLTWKS